MTDAAWDALTARFPPELVEKLREKFRGGGDLDITAAELALAADTEDQPAQELLKELAKVGEFAIEQRFVCPCERKELLAQDQASAEKCARCDQVFDRDVQGRPTPRIVYVRRAPQTCDVDWILVVHGMNTPGAWQETFSWLSARIYGRSVPVAIYKYGIVRPGAILKFRQRALTRQLQARMRRLAMRLPHQGVRAGPTLSPTVSAPGCWGMR